MTTHLRAHIPAHHRRSYSIAIGSGLLEQIGALVPRPDGRIAVITDTKVKKLYARALVETLQQRYEKVTLLTFRGGEQAKNLNTVTSLVAKMLTNSCGRDTLVVAVGGGVVGDVAGFVAAVFMRGVPFMQVPTTLLAMVDSSVGGKTGVDTSYGKNLIGAFHPPVGVVIDVDCVQTLPPRHLINGLCEALKMFVTSDVRGVAFFERSLDRILTNDVEILQRLITRTLRIKCRIVAADPYERNQRMVLNFGHTIGHALEQESDYRLLHGYAVAYGMLVEARIAFLSGFLDADGFTRLSRILGLMGIQGSILRKFSSARVIARTRYDKKARGGNVCYVMLRRLGEVRHQDGVYSFPVGAALVKQAWNEIALGRVVNSSQNQDLGHGTRA